MKKEDMEITVNEQPQYFHLAFERKGEPNWQRKAGHEISVGPYRFCAIPMNDCINISEVSTGQMVDEIELSPAVMMLTETKEDALKFFRVAIGAELKKKIERMDSFGEQLEKRRKEVIERYGEMPPITDVDIDLFEAVGEVLERRFKEC